MSSGGVSDHVASLAPAEDGGSLFTRQPGAGPQFHLPRSIGALLHALEAGASTKKRTLNKKWDLPPAMLLNRAVRIAPKPLHMRATGTRPGAALKQFKLKLKALRRLCCSVRRPACRYSSAKSEASGTSLVADTLQSRVQMLFTVLPWSKEADDGMNRRHEETVGSGCATPSPVVSPVPRFSGLQFARADLFTEPA